MNAPRRKSIQEVIDQLEELKSTIETIMDEEQEAYDNLPEPPTTWTAPTIAWTRYWNTSPLPSMDRR